MESTATAFNANTHSSHGAGTFTKCPYSPPVPPFPRSKVKSFIAEIPAPKTWIEANTRETKNIQKNNLREIGKAFYRLVSIFRLDSYQLTKYIKFYIKQNKTALASCTNLSLAYLQESIHTYTENLYTGDGKHVFITLEEFARLTNWNPIKGITVKARTKRKAASASFIQRFISCNHYRGYPVCKISCGGLGKALDFSPETAMYFLREQVKQGVLTIVTKGEAKTNGSATEYSLVQFSEENTMDNLNCPSIDPWETNPVKKSNSFDPEDLEDSEDMPIVTKHDSELTEDEEAELESELFYYAIGTHPMELEPAEKKTPDLTDEEFERMWNELMIDPQPPKLEPEPGLLAAYADRFERECIDGGSGVNAPESVVRGISA